MRERAKEILRRNWREVVKDGNLTEEELRNSLEDQISGYLDLSMDELTEEECEAMGWEYGNMTDEQMDEWTEIVNETAKEYLAK